LKVIGSARFFPWAASDGAAGVLDNHLQLATLDVYYSKGNSKLCKELNVQALPTLQFYYRGDLLKSFSCSPEELYRLERAVDYYL
jgi:hypothetical protein